MWEDGGGDPASYPMLLPVFDMPAGFGQITCRSSSPIGVRAALVDSSNDPSKRHRLA